MSGLFDFLSSIFSKDNSDHSVVIKNIISGNNNQKNNHSSKSKGKPPKLNRQKTSSNPTLGQKTDIIIQNVRLYATGAKGKVYTNKFYKSINHNFGVELMLYNNTSKSQIINIGHCIYNKNGETVFKGNFHPKVNPKTQFIQDIFIPASKFINMKNGTYRSQVWVNDKMVQKNNFTIVTK